MSHPFTLSALRDATLDVAYPNRPTPVRVSMLSKPPSNKPRIHFHNLTLGHFQLVWFIGFGARNLTLKYHGRAIVKLAVSL